MSVKIGTLSETRSIDALGKQGPSDYVTMELTENIVIYREIRMVSAVGIPLIEIIHARGPKQRFDVTFVVQCFNVIFASSA